MHAAMPKTLDKFSAQISHKHSISTEQTLCKTVRLYCRLRVCTKQSATKF